MVTPLTEEAIVTTSSTASVLRCIPKSRRKDHESPFTERITLDSTSKAISIFKETNWQVLNDKGALPTHKASETKVARDPLSSFVQ